MRTFVTAAVILVVFVMTWFTGRPQSFAAMPAPALYIYDSDGGVFDRYFASAPRGSAMQIETSINFYGDPWAPLDRTPPEPPYQEFFGNVFRQAQQNGIRVLVYIDANGGESGYDSRGHCRSLLCIHEYIDQYVRLYGNQQRASVRGERLTNGIMFDDGFGVSHRSAPDAERTWPFYRDIYRYARDAGFYPIMLNVSLPLADQDEALMHGDTQVADIIVNHEMRCNRFREGGFLPAPNWWGRYPAWRKMEEVYDCSSEQDMRNFVQWAKEQGAGLINVQGRYTEEWAVYDELPIYWELQVQLVTAGMTVGDLTDTFGSTEIDRNLWSETADSGASVEERDGALNLNIGPSQGSVAAVTSRAAYSMLGQALTVQIVENVSPDSSANNIVALMPEPTDYDNSVRWVQERGTLYAQIRFEGREIPVGSVRADNIEWARIRENQGNVFFEYYDSSSKSWVQLGASVPTVQIFPLDSVYVKLMAHTWGAGIPTRARYANLNMGFPTHR